MNQLCERPSTECSVSATVSPTVTVIGGPGLLKVAAVDPHPPVMDPKSVKLSTCARAGKAANPAAAIMKTSVARRIGLVAFLMLLPPAREPLPQDKGFPKAS